MKKLMKSLICVALVVGLVSCASHKVQGPDGEWITVSQQTVVTEAQKEIAKDKVEKVRETISQATTTEQAMLAAFWLGKDKDIQMVVTKNWVDYGYDFAKLFLMNGGFPNLGGRNTQSGANINIKGNNNSVSGFNHVDSRRDSVLTLSDTDSTSNQTSVTETTDLHYNREENTNAP